MPGIAVRMALQKTSSRPWFIVAPTLYELPAERHARQVKHRDHEGQHAPEADVHVEHGADEGAEDETWHSPDKTDLKSPGDGQSATRSIASKRFGDR